VPWLIFSRFPLFFQPLANVRGRIPGARRGLERYSLASEIKS
jgi:hypothetical protein